MHHRLQIDLIPKSWTQQARMQVEVPPCLICVELLCDSVDLDGRILGPAESPVDDADEVACDVVFAVGYGDGALFDFVTTHGWRRREKE